MSLCHFSGFAAAAYLREASATTTRRGRRKRKRRRSVIHLHKRKDLAGLARRVFSLARVFDFKANTSWQIPPICLWTICWYYKALLPFCSITRGCCVAGSDKCCTPGLRLGPSGTSGSRLCGQNNINVIKAVNRSFLNWPVWFMLSGHQSEISQLS